MLPNSPSRSAATSAKAAGIPPDSPLGYVFESRPFAVTGADQRISYVSGEYWTPILGLDRESIATQLAIDPGNSGCKSAALHHQRRTLEIVETSALYEEYPNLIYSTGQDEVFRVRYYDDAQLRAYQVQYQDAPDKIPPQFSDPFSVGPYALKGKALPIGATNERLHDLPYQRFLQACVVRTLIEAGYAPGHHYVGYAIGVRDEEVSAQTGVAPLVKAAVNEVLKRPFVLVRNNVEVWSITPAEEDILMVPQSFGMYYGWDSDVWGGRLHNAPAYTVFDLGFHDGHVVEIIRGQTGGTLRVSGHKVVQGISEIARGLAIYMRQPNHFPQLPELNDAEAIEMLHAEQVKLGGIPLEDEREATRAKRLISGYKHNQGATFIATLVSQHPKMDSIFLFGGGGVIEFTAQIQGKMTATQRTNSLFFVFPPSIAVKANVIGLYWLKNIACRAKAAKR